MKGDPMSSRIRFLPRLAVAALAVALLLGCPSVVVQKPFRYSGPPDQPRLVEISSDCKANPDPSVIDVKLINLGNPHAQVLWHVVGKQPNDRVVISGGDASLITSEQRKNSQASRAELQGQKIPNLFQEEYVIPEADDSIRSGVPKDALKYLQNKGDSVVWKYAITYYRDGKPLCTLDPRVCVQKVGEIVCWEA